MGASAEFRELRQECYISREIIQTICIQLTLRESSYCYIFGSSSEATTIPSLNSDLDVLACRDTPVVENIREAGNGLSYLIVRDTHTQPGYVKLQLVYNGQSLTVYTRDIDREYEESDSEGRICLKHLSKIGKDIYSDTRNGPADTSSEYNIDNVPGFRCSTMPEFAREWIGRHREYKWPSKRMLDKMATMGCFFVGVGYPTSRDRTIEWRISFSLQERELMFNMNMVQHKCYIILKIIKKDLIEPIVGKSISSYHLKTCMFYSIENSKLSFWKRDNLCQCVLLCLCVLFKWVNTGYCPNYFITEENMFDRDIHRRQRLNLLHQIRFLLSQGCGFLFLIKLDNLGVLLKHGIGKVQIDLNLNKARFKQKFRLIEKVFMFRKSLYYRANTYDNARDFVAIILKYLSDTKSIKDHNEQQTQKAFSHILPYIHLQLSQSYASLAFISYNEEDKCKLLQKSGHHLRQGRHCDLTSSVLLEATVFLKLEQYERCLSILERLELELKQRPLSGCGCYTGSINCTDKHVSQLYSLNILECVGIISTCIIFPRSDMSITPEALQYEMFRSINTPPGSIEEKRDNWFDMAVVDAVVYLHFIQYLVHAKLNRRIHKHIAIHKLESVLKSEKNLRHRETGYNLLGWIHFHENWIPRGIKYFQTSWSIRPHHNAAKLHMLKLINDINN